MSKIILSNVSNLIDTVTSAATINNNSSTIQTAFDNTLSRDGTSPNTMGSNFDMNNFNILNLPPPSTNNSPLRLSDLTKFLGTGTISLLPVGGTTNQILGKLSNTDYNVGWLSLSNLLTSGSNITITGNTVNVVSNPSFGGVIANTVNGLAISSTTSGVLTILSNKTFTANNTLTLAGTDATTITFQGTDTYVGRATTDTLTNKSISGSTNTLSSIPNSALTNSSITLGSTSMALGSTNTTIAGGLTWSGAHTFNGGLTIPSTVTGNSYVGGPLFFNQNIGGSYPSSNSGGTITVNFSNGSSEIDLFNTTTTSSESFRFYQQTAAAAATLLVKMAVGGIQIGAPTGAGQGANTLNVQGLIYNNGTSPTGTGGYVLSTSPSLVTPVIGVATGTSLSTTGGITAYSGTSVPAGGTTGTGFNFSSTTNLGVYFGSGAPTLSAAQGSLYVNTTGNSTSTRLYVNTNGTTGWTNVTTAT